MSQRINSTEISSLPPEMIAKIFEFLTFDERLTAARTCKAWHQLAFSAKFSKKMCIKIDTNSLDVFRNTRDFQKYRHANVTEFVDALLDLVKKAPFESLKIYSDSRNCIKTFLADHLPCMKMLTRLHLVLTRPAIQDSDSGQKGILKINHPSLKSLTIYDRSFRESFEINCPNLIDLTMDNENEIIVTVVTQLQHQLQSLKLNCFAMPEAKMLQTDILGNVELSNLKKLCLSCRFMRANFELSFERMVNLVELQVELQQYSCFAHTLTVGEQLSVLTSLSKLTLCALSIDTKGFSKALRKMDGLIDLGLIQCKFKPSTQSCQVTSDTVRNLHLVYDEHSSVLLPNFTNLQQLSATFSLEEIDEPFVLICNAYPELEELRFESKNPTLLKFHSPTTSFAQIGMLKQLKHLQLVGLDPEGIDWTPLKDTEIGKLTLSHCRVRGTAAQQLIETIGRGMNQLELDQCLLYPPRADLFDISADCVEGLRKSLPWCGVSYKECDLRETEMDVCFW